MYDSIIIGSGPAGITASLYMVRAGLKVLIISKNESTLDKAEHIENYYGFENGISGKDLNDVGIKQAQNLGVEFLEKEVISIKYAENGYEVVVANQGIDEKYLTKTIVLATGTNRNRPRIKGIKEFEGKGISYCAICDGAFFRNKDVGVLGNGDYAVSEIEELLPLVKSVTMYTNGLEPIQYRSENVNINTKKIREFRGENVIQEIEFEDDSVEQINGMFVALGVATSTDFAKKLGAMIENNYIVVNDKMETTVPNIYACGDCTGGLLQISKAVYEGTVAGLEVIRKLKM
ncbi:MAG: NAD(P)/FAD-dependent oxidoreductase [Clostridia bacterium]|nr:NAD(P)/FAD-dependent oxidoreductase [Clostridia bacterium]